MFGRREKKAIEDFIAGVYDRIEVLALQLRCMEDYGGHDWVFFEYTPSVVEWVELWSDPWSGTYGRTTLTPHGSKLDGPYKFKCNRCGHVRSFKWDELTKQDQSALIALGLHKESDDK